MPTSTVVETLSWWVMAWCMSWSCPKTLGYTILSSLRGLCCDVFPQVKGPSPAAQLFMGAAALLMAGGAALLQMVRGQTPKLAEKPRYTWNMAATAGGVSEAFTIATCPLA